MSKQSVINARTDQETKSQAEAVFFALGLSTTQAINLFLKQVIYTQSIPFDLKIPRELNTKTQEIFEKTDRGEELTECDSLEDMMNQLKS